MSDKTKDIIKSDFNEIALLERDNWTSNHLYYPYILKKLPPSCDVILEVGCGTGTLTRLLAERAKRVVAIDFAENMINEAKSKSHEQSNIEYIIGDAMEYQYPGSYFDFIVSVATLHHMPLEDILHQLKESLKPNGVLVIIDFYELNKTQDLTTKVIAPFLNKLLKYINTGQFKKNPEISRAWDKHLQNDKYLSFHSLENIYKSFFETAKIKKHILWRYSIVWKKE